MQRACALLSSVATFSHKRHDFRKKKKELLNKKCVFWFCLQLLSETFLILWRTERDMVKKYIGLHVKYRLFLSDFNETWIFSTDVRKILKYQIFMKIHPLGAEPGCSMRTDGPTDRRYEPNSRFSQFCERAYKRSIGECSNAVSSAITRLSLRLIGCNAVDEQMNAVRITLRGLSQK
jgi:hypothetical protein